MILRWIKKKLIQKRNKERQKLIKLRWQQAELERKIELAKQEHEHFC